jgi:hypothetical protein
MVPELIHHGAKVRQLRHPTPEALKNVFQDHS